MGRRLAQGPVRLGVQEPGRGSRQGLRPVTALCPGARQSAAVDHLRPAAVPGAHQLDLRRLPGARDRAGRSARPREAADPEMGVQRPRPAASDAHARGVDRGSGGAFRRACRPSGTSGACARQGRALPDPLGLLHVRRERGVAARPSVLAHAGQCRPASRPLRGQGGATVRGDEVRWRGRVRRGAVVQRRPVRRRGRAAAGRHRDRGGAGGGGAGLVGHRPGHHGHAVRARPDPGTPRRAGPRDRAAQRRRRVIGRGRHLLHACRDHPSADRVSCDPAAPPVVGAGKGGDPPPSGQGARRLRRERPAASPAAGRERLPHHAQGSRPSLFRTG